MEHLAAFFFEHAIGHAPAVSRSDGATDDPVVRGTSVAQVRLRPGPGLNSLAWILWHLARTEDVGIGLMLAGEEPLLEAEGWSARLGVDWRDTGAGMSEADVAELSERVDVAALLAYRLAVGKRTRELVRTVPIEWLRDPAPAGRIERLKALRAVNPRLPAGVVEQQWGSWPLSNFLLLGSGHNLLHLGEATTLRSMIERARPDPQG